MARSRIFPAALLLFGLFLSAIARAQSPGDELAPLPLAPTAEQLRGVASLSSFAEPIPSGMLPEGAKDSIRAFTRQGLWPIRVEYEDGSEYWGEVSEIGCSTFKLLNRQTHQEKTLSYAGMRSIGIVKTYGAPSDYPLPHASERRRLSIPEPQLSPEQVSYKLAAEKLGVDEHRVVHFELKDHSVVTGTIVAIGPEDFRVRPGMLHQDHVIRYHELGAPPRPTAAVGTHLKNGLEVAGLVALCVVLLPVCLLGVGE